MRKAATVTVTGWAGTTPKETTGDGVPFTSFRVSVTERWFDPKVGQWCDGAQEWFTVKAFRDLAVNVAETVRKGDPVVVTGRLRTEVWESDKGPQPSFVIEADAVGHDLSWGSGTFRRRVHRSGPVDAPEPVDPGAMPPDPWATDGATPAEVDVASTP